MRIYIRKFEDRKQTLYYYIDVNDIVNDTAPEVSINTYTVTIPDIVNGVFRLRHEDRMNLRVNYNDGHGRPWSQFLNICDNLQIRLVTDEYVHPNKILMNWTELNKDTIYYIANILELAIAIHRVDKLKDTPCITNNQNNTI